ncbi:hypothetical protein [Thalassoroseus pseudoceratinae]|uniref:hypothetical protein n=1 Tax=Thalassoroseus pseudoceratinae TaxID=2713176 RepID=UPI00141EFB12|nr:hypothetical protein [Thalassoroseus pseudoceratinae]
MSWMSWKTRLATMAAICCLAVSANSLRAEDAPTESVGHASVYTAPIPEADPGAGLFEPVTQLAGDSCGPCAANHCGPYPQAFHPPVYYPGLTDYAPTCFGTRDWFKETFGCLQHRANQKRLMAEYETRLQTAHWPTCCPPWACWGHYCDECANVGCKQRCCLSGLLGSDSDECHTGCSTHCTENCSSSHGSPCIPGDSGASVTDDSVISLASYDPSELELIQPQSSSNLITLVGHEEVAEEEEGVYHLGPAPGVQPTNCTVQTPITNGCVTGNGCVTRPTGGCNSTACNTVGCNGGCRNGGNGCQNGSGCDSSSCWSWSGLGGGSTSNTGWAMPFCNNGDGRLSSLFCKHGGTYVDENGVTHECRRRCFGHVHDLIPSCQMLQCHCLQCFGDCSWGFHDLNPAGHDCEARGNGFLRVGKYNVAYETNPWHFDARDGRIYAAQGTGMPTGMPLAPNVQKTFNFGWGTPVSRLTPIWRNPQQYGP